MSDLYIHSSVWTSSKSSRERRKVITVADDRNFANPTATFLTHAPGCIITSRGDNCIEYCVLIMLGISRLDLAASAGCARDREDGEWGEGQEQEQGK